MIVPAQTEQGFRIHASGNLSREIVDMDGLYVVREPAKKKPCVRDDEPPF